MADDDKIVNLGEKLRNKAANVELRRRLSRTIREMRETGATPKQIASALREAAEDLDRNSSTPA